MSNIVVADFKWGHKTTTKTVYRYNVGQRLKFINVDQPQSYRVDFSNSVNGVSKSVMGNDEGVVIPYEYFIPGKEIYAWIVLSDGDDSRITEYEAKIIVDPRAEPLDDEPLPEEQEIITQAINALNTTISNANEAVSHYPKIIDGYWYVWDVTDSEYVTTGVKSTGEDGVSPVVTVESITGGHRVTITDANGDHVFDVLDGVNGDPGRGIATIAKTGTSGLVDTYTITYTNGDVQTYTVTNGADGVSPTIVVSSITGGYRLTITDAQGTQTVDVLDGTDGDDGRGIVSIEKTGTSGLVDTYTITYTDNTTATFTVTNGKNGTDGYSPTASVSKNGSTATITITDKQGTTTAQITDGQNGSPGASAYVWIRYAAAEPTQDSDMKTTPDAWMGIYSGDSATAPTAYTAYTWYNIKGQTGPVQDVQVNGTSVLSNGVANIAAGSNTNLGVVKGSSTYGVTIWGGSTAGQLATAPASANQIKAGNQQYAPITPTSQYQSVFYGLAKAAGDSTQSASSNAVGTYTEEAKKKIRKMLGAASGEWELIANVTVSEDTESLDILTDTNGQPFKLSKIYVRAWLEPSTTGTADFIAASNNVVRVSDQNTYSASPTVKYMANGAKTFFEYKSEIICGVCYSFGSASSVPSSTASVNKISSNLDDIACIRGFKLSKYGNATSLIPKDSIIKIYGIRIDE